ncbi:unnamed protein product [Ilex paraguariensis]|uniref:Uncharacterized protein n=1 Tax=Ilex paraguariensis TaxID=185542 RepID=A0ABC8US74_9AQUA
MIEKDSDLVKCESDELGSRSRWKGGLILKKNHQTHKRQRLDWRVEKEAPYSSFREYKFENHKPDSPTSLRNRHSKGHQERKERVSSPGNSPLGQ